MRTTVDLDDKILADAMEYTGIKQKTALLEAGLQALIAREASKRLAMLGGTMPNFEPGRRLRSRPGH